MDRRNDRIRRRRQEAVDLMRPGDRLRFGTTVAVERRPDAGKAEQRAGLVECEPDDILFLCFRIRLRRVLGKAVGWHQAAAFRLEPHAPMRR